MANWLDMPNYLRYAGRDLRVSDAERNDVTDILSRHYGDGRLDQAEFDARVDAAMHAKTRSELVRVLGDLPRLDEPATAPVPARSHSFGFLLVFALVVAIAVSATLNALFHAVAVWPFVLLAVFLVMRGRHRGYRHHRGYRYPG